MKPRSKVLVVKKSFRLIREGRSKYLVAIPKGGNRKLIRTLCYTESEEEALKKFYEFTAGIDSTASLVKKLDHLKTIKCKNKHSNPLKKSRNDICFKKGRLGSKLRQFLEKEQVKPNSKSYISTLRTVVRSLNNVITNETTLTASLIEVFFNQYTKKDNHASPATINSYKKVLSKICQFVGVEMKSIVKGVDFYNEKQLKKLGIRFRSKNRNHLERSELKALIPELLKIECNDTRVALFIQLISGCRPTDGFKYELTENSIIINANKTDTIIQINKTKVISALLHVLEIPSRLNPELNTDLKKYNLIFKKCVQQALGERYAQVDRYCLRHTVLTQRVITENPKIVAMQAGHMSLRMIDENYVKDRVVHEDGPIAECRPINIDGLEDSYHSLLLEYILVFYYPSLIDGVIPECSKFKSLSSIFKDNNKKYKRKKIF